ncbi:MAG: hypothetical protein ACOYMA_13695 [Bacteroidia bacterium]
MEWKEDLGIFLASKSVFRLEDLSNQLKEITDEWKSYISKFDGIYMKYDTLNDFSTIHSPKGIRISYNICNQYISNLKPYIIEIKYFEAESHLISLAIKYSVGFERMQLLMENSLVYIFEERTYDGNEIYEPAYVHQILNNILKIHFNIKNH